MHADEGAPWQEKNVIKSTGISNLADSLVLISLVSMSAMMFTNLKGSLGRFFSLQAGFEVPGRTPLPVSANTVTEGKVEFTLSQINVAAEFSITCSVLE